MKKFLLLLPFFSSLTFSQTNIYHPFPMSSDSATWSVFEYTQSLFGNKCYAYHYGFYGDTLIGSRLYSKLYANNLSGQTNDSSFHILTAQYVFAVREDTLKKVWVRRPADTADVLYYDFSLNVGDTFCFNYFNAGCYTVYLIDSILVNGNYRKQIHISQIYQESWIEGIGSETGWEHFPYFASFWTQLACYSDNDTLKYNSIINCHCNDYLGVAELDDDKSFSVFPNPAANQFTLLSSEKIKSIEVSDILGKRVLVKEGSSKREGVSLNQPPGIYFVKVIYEKGNYAVKKIVIE